MTQIVKTSGEYESFDKEKLRDSLLRASASLLVTNDVISKVEKRVKEGMSTDDIHKLAFELLKKKEKRTALRYSVKRSLLELGPTGFPFEKFVAEIFKAKGYTTNVGVRLPGRCVEHEIDVLAYDEKDLIYIEVKFHNSLSLKTDTKVALYVKARWDDLLDMPVRLENNIDMKPTRGILLTNTGFTENSITYARCNDMGMISWNYPRRGNLFDLINETNLHPISVVTELSNNQKRRLIDNGVITCNQVIEDKSVLDEFNLTAAKKGKVMDEVRGVCGI